MSATIETKISATIETKKYINKLGRKLSAAKKEVELLQSTVNGTTQKLALFGELLIASIEHLEYSTKNKVDLDAIIHQVIELEHLADPAAHPAQNSADKLAIGFAPLVDEVIQATELIQQFSQLVVRNKATDHLFPDELIRQSAQAEALANRAVASCLVTLKSTSNTQAATASIASAALANQEIHDFHNFLNETATQVDQTYQKAKADTAELDQAYNEIASFLQAKKEKLGMAKFNMEQLNSEWLAAQQGASFTAK